MELPGGAFLSSVSIGSEEELLFAGLAVMPLLSADENLSYKLGDLLHPAENATALIMASEIRRASYINGRQAAKLAILRLFPELEAAAVNIETGTLGEPIATGLPGPYAVSLAHSEHHAAGLCFPSVMPMGVDIETPGAKNGETILSTLSAHEKSLLKGEQDSLDYLHVLWTAKEAVGKAIRLGFRIPLERYEISHTEILSRCDRTCYLCHFTRLAGFASVSRHWNGAILTVAFPDIEGNLDPVKRLLRIGVE